MARYTSKVNSAAEEAYTYPVLPDLNPPTGLNITSKTTTSATINWDWVRGDGRDVARFDIYVRPAGGAWPGTPTNTTNALGRDAVLSGLTGNSSYDVRVVAVSAAPEEQASATISFVTATGAAEVAPVRDLEAIGHTDTSITVDWEWEANGGLAASGFEIRYRQPPGTGTWSAPQTVGGAVRSQQITGLSPDLTYEIEVVAVSGATRSPAVTTQATTTGAASPEPPTGLVIQESGTPDTFSHMATYRWTAPATGAAPATYELEWTLVWDGLPESSETVAVGAPRTWEMVDAATSGGRYGGRVRSRTAGGAVSEWAVFAPVTLATNRVEQPQRGRIVSTSNGQATIGWHQMPRGIVPTQYATRYRTPGGTWFTGPVVAFVPGQLDYQTVITGLTGGQNYEFEVTATDGTRNSTPLTFAGFVEAGGAGPQVPGEEEPPAPATMSGLVSWACN